MLYIITLGQRASLSRQGQCGVTLLRKESLLLHTSVWKNLFRFYLRMILALFLALDFGSLFCSSPAAMGFNALDWPTAPVPMGSPVSTAVSFLSMPAFPTQHISGSAPASEGQTYPLSLKPRRLEVQGGLQGLYSPALRCWVWPAALSFRHLFVFHCS